MSGIRTYFPIIMGMLAISFFTLFNFTEAQTMGVANQSTLEISPQYPEPDTEVTVTLNAYSINTTGATIAWYVDGVELQQFRNARSISLNSGGLGESQVVRAVVTPQNGASFGVTNTISPIQLDIIIEADTNIPSFYKGRALPAAGAPVRIIAIPYAGRGQNVSSYTYKWELDGKVLFGGPLKGKNVVETTMPLYNDGTLIVTVLNASNDIVARKLVRLAIAEPEIHFYEDNPLRGISRRTVGEPFTLIGEEVTVRGVPFFMNTGLENSSGMYEWRLDKQLIENPSADPHAITLRKTGGSGSALVELAVFNTKELLQYAQGTFRIFFE